jgi:ribosomal protein S27E
MKRFDPKESCPKCGAAPETRGLSYTPDRMGPGSAFIIVRCVRCGFTCHVAPLDAVLCMDGSETLGASSPSPFPYVSN